MPDHPTPAVLGLHLAWRFTEVLPGSFEREREETRGIKFPILGPLPPNGSRTPPLEGQALSGPYLYVVFDGFGVVKYVGKATEKGLGSPLERWIRPDKITGREYWAHGTNKKKSTVNWIADGLAAGAGPFALYFSNYRHFIDRVRAKSELLRQPFDCLAALTPEAFVDRLEHALIFGLQPEWNASRKRRPPDGSIAACGCYW